MVHDELSREEPKTGKIGGRMGQDRKVPVEIDELVLLPVKRQFRVDVRDPLWKQRQLDLWRAPILSPPLSLASRQRRVFLASSTPKSQIALWDTATHLELMRFEAERAVYDLQISLDGSGLPTLQKKSHRRIGG
jgi:hypothetical protein